MAVEKYAALGKPKTLSNFSTATTIEFGSKFHQGLLRREGDETTVNGVTVNLMLIMRP
jgi:hypothetical protein